VGRERRDQDDAAATAQDRQQLPHEEEGCPNVDGEEIVEIFDRGVHDRRSLGRARIRHEDIQPIADDTSGLLLIVKLLGLSAEYAVATKPPGPCQRALAPARTGEDLALAKAREPIPSRKDPVSSTECDGWPPMPAPRHRHSCGRP
jgi:hypothetical protein